MFVIDKSLLHLHYVITVFSRLSFTSEVFFVVVVFKSLPSLSLSCGREIPLPNPPSHSPAFVSAALAPSGCLFGFCRSSQQQCQHWEDISG